MSLKNIMFYVPDKNLENFSQSAQTLQDVLIDFAPSSDAIAKINDFDSKLSTKSFDIIKPKKLVDKPDYSEFKIVANKVFNSEDFFNLMSVLYYNDVYIKNIKIYADVDCFNNVVDFIRKEENYFKKVKNPDKLKPVYMIKHVTRAISSFSNIDSASYVLLKNLDKYDKENIFSIKIETHSKPTKEQYFGLVDILKDY